MDTQEMLRLTESFLSAWNTQDTDRVLACYTPDVEYRDPNTRGSVSGEAAMRRYLNKLFASWKMHWSLREAHLFENGNGCNVLWHATFQRGSSDVVVEVDGMDFVRVQDGRIKRNEVQFDRAALAPLLGS